MASRSPSPSLERLKKFGEGLAVCALTGSPPRRSRSPCDRTQSPEFHYDSASVERTVRDGMRKHFETLRRRSPPPPAPLEVASREHRSAAEEWAAEKEELLQTVAKLHETNEALFASLEEMNGAIQGCDRRHAEAEAARTALEEENASLKQRVAVLEAELQERDNDDAVLQQKVEAALGEVKGGEVCLKALAARVRHLQGLDSVKSVVEAERRTGDALTAMHCALSLEKSLELKAATLQQQLESLRQKPDAQSLQVDDDLFF